MSGVLSQIQAFALTMLLGGLAGLVFHYYQLTVRQAKVGKYSLYFLDFVLWIIMILLIFLAMLMINQGEMRVYVLVALVIGILFYHHRLGSVMEPAVSRAAKITISAFSLLIGVIKRPLIGLWGVIRRLANRGKRPPPPEDPEI